tara:strand:+ start:6922 stop:7122 length:201 start_codon:yes stop_codon:yes gene_type:complete
MGYSSEELTILLGGIAAAVASIVYAFKNVKHLKSGCLECDQQVEDDCPEQDRDYEHTIEYLNVTTV